MTTSEGAARVEQARRVREADEQRTVEEAVEPAKRWWEESRHIVDFDGAMNDEARRIVQQGITVLAQSVSNTAHSHGWWESDRNFGEMIALMHAELSEALEAWRDGDDYTKISYEHNGQPVSRAYVDEFLGGSAKPIGVASEFADVIIRILDTCQTLNIPVAQALIEKAQYNISRPYRHGGKLA
jgi:NTP pyrophosphatase (non-canonical NTP hydrolase)